MYTRWEWEDNFFTLDWILRDFWYQDEFWLEVSSVRWLFRKGSFKCSIIIPKILLTNSNYTLLPYAQNMTSEREFQSVRKFSISISLMSPAKVGRFATQLSCHKSATATVSWKSIKSINTGLTGATQRVLQNPHSRLNNSSKKFSLRSLEIHYMKYQRIKKIYPRDGN